jgi:dTDP-4-amino-4,6-dideoxygalactose transaminase
MIPVNRPLIAPEDLLAVEASLKDTFISGEIPVVKQMESMLAEVVQAKSAVAV